MSNHRKYLIQDFLRRHGWLGASRQPITNDASFRKYERLYDGVGCAILMDAPPDKENILGFIEIARILKAWGCRAPEILAEDIQNGLKLPKIFKMLLTTKRKL